MPEMPRGKPSPRASAGRDVERDGDTLGRLRVRYYRRMRWQRVYTVVAAWEGDGGRARTGAPPVTLRLLMAGAQIVPAEHTLDPGDPDARATFYVTPLAKGWLRNERLEVLVGDRKVQEVPLPAKVTSQGWTLAFLVLAFLLPWFVLSFGKYAPLEMTRLDIDKAELERAIRLVREEKAVPKDPKKPTETPGFGEGQVKRVRDAILEGDVPMSEVKRNLKSVFKSPGDILAGRIDRELPEMPEFAKEPAKTVREKIAALYDNFIRWNEQYPIAFCLFVGLLLLALVSFILHQDRRRTRLSKAIPMPRTTTAAVPGHREELEAVEVD